MSHGFEYEDDSTQPMDAEHKPFVFLAQLTEARPYPASDFSVDHTGSPVVSPRSSTHLHRTSSTTKRMMPYGLAMGSRFQVDTSEASTSLTLPQFFGSSGLKSSTIGINSSFSMDTSCDGGENRIENGASLSSHGSVGSLSSAGSVGSTSGTVGSLLNSNGSIGGSSSNHQWRQAGKQCSALRDNQLKMSQVRSAKRQSEVLASSLHAKSMPTSPELLPLNTTMAEPSNIAESMMRQCSLSDDLPGLRRDRCFGMIASRSHSTIRVQSRPYDRPIDAVLHPTISEPRLSRTVSCVMPHLSRTGLSASCSQVDNHPYDQAEAAPPVRPLDPVPTINAQSGQCITPDTLRDLMNGVYNEHFKHVVIIDCRYPYEYEGGHIRGALNLSICMDTNRYLFNRNLPNFDSQVAIVFHCEFSSKRGPAMLKYVRNLDREFNLKSWPALYYPFLYLLKGGYKDFFEVHPEHCDGIYRTMKDSSYRTIYKDSKRHHDCQNSLQRLNRSMSVPFVRPPVIISGAGDSMQQQQHNSNEMGANSRFATGIPRGYACGSPIAEDNSTVNLTDDSPMSPMGIATPLASQTSMLSFSQASPISPTVPYDVSPSTASNSPTEMSRGVPSQLRRYASFAGSSSIRRLDFS